MPQGERHGSVPTPGTAFVWADDLPEYDFGPGHPMAPIRMVLTRDLVRALDLPGVQEIDVATVDDATLALVHSPAFIQSVRAGALGVVNEARGIGTVDNPLFPEMHVAARRIVGSTLAAVNWVWQGHGSRAVSIAGGMHHAMPDKVSGFCVYNDCAVAIASLLEQGAQRVLYIDLDAHHGDGVEKAFWDDPRVLTVSIHESGTTLFPGTGFAQDIGGPNARGYAVNLPLPARTRGDAWLRAFDAVVPQLVAEFNPDIIVSQHGADAHGNDQLTNLRVSVDHQLAAARMVRELATEHAGGRWVATGGGGYTVVEVVPRVWAGLVALSAGLEPDLSSRLPLSWQRDVEQRLHLPAPEFWGDGIGVQLRPFSAGYDPADDVDRAILATRAAIYPLHGLDPAW